MKYLLILCTFGLLLACGEEVVDTPKEDATKAEELVVVKDGIFTEYYPGKKKIKFQGPQDKAGQRDGIWYFYSEEGIKISMTEFRHGKKNGVSLHKYPNGSVQYSGEYEDDKPIGLWKTYDEKGKLVDSTNYTKLNETRK